MCGWTSTAKNKALGLKTHIRRKKHKWNPARQQRSEKRDIKQKKLADMQQEREHVCWGEMQVNNC